VVDFLTAIADVSTEPTRAWKTRFGRSTRNLNRTENLEPSGAKPPSVLPSPNRTAKAARQPRVRGCFRRMRTPVPFSRLSRQAIQIQRVGRNRNTVSSLLRGRLRGCDPALVPQRGIERCTIRLDIEPDTDEGICSGLRCG